MRQRASSRGPAYGAGPQAGNGLSQFSKAKGRNQGPQFQERFPFMVNAILYCSMPEWEGQIGVVNVGRKDTILSTRLERQENGKILSTVVHSLASHVNFFTMRAAEHGKWRYGRVFCSHDGSPLPEHLLQNRRFLGQEGHNRRGITQPVFVGLTRLMVVEAVGRIPGWEITIFSFLKDTRTDKSICLGDEQYFLSMPDSLARPFYKSDYTGDLPDQAEVESTIRDYLLEQFDSEEEIESWASMVPAMATAYRKAMGDEYAWYVRPVETEQDAESKPEKEQEAAPQPEEPQALQATGTDGPSFESGSSASAPAKKPRKKKPGTKKE